MRSLFFLGSFLGLIGSTTAFGILNTAYVSFEQPDGWKCELSQGVWICQSTLEADRKEAVVLSIATMATEWDSLENYEEYLKQPRTIQDEEGNTLTAKVSYTRRRNISGVTWVDSLQLNSELPGFWARYLGTVHVTGQSKLAILITYIVSEAKYSQMAPQFERMVASLKPNADFDMNVAAKQGETPPPGSTVLGPKRPNLAELLNTKKKKDDGDKKEQGDGEEGSPLATVVVLIVGVGAVIYVLRRQRKAKAKVSAKGKAPVPRRPGPPKQS